MRLKLCLAVLKPMNFTPKKWVQICQSLGPAYSERHCKYHGSLSRLCIRRLKCVRNEWKSLMKDEAEEPSSTILGSVPDSSMSSKIIKQLDDNASDDQDEKSKASLSDLRHKSPKSSRKGKTPVPAELSTKRKKVKKVTAITSEKKNARQQLSDDSNNDEPVPQNSIRRKTKKDDDNPEIEATINSVRENVERENDSDFAARSGIDSYRPSYPDNQTLYRSDGSVVRPGPRHNTQHYPNARQGPRTPEVLGTRSQSHSGARTPYSGGGQTQGQKNSGQQAMKQPLPRHTPQGPKNPQHHRNHSHPAGGARNPAWSPAHPPHQNSGAKTPGGNQATRTNEDPAPRMPARSGYCCPTPAPSGGRTPAHFVDREPSRSWNRKNSHNNSQQRPNENSRTANSHLKSSSQRGFTGGTHHHFEDEHGYPLLVSR